MPIQRLDENGNYRYFDPNTNRFLDEDEYPLGSNIGQTEHQMRHTNKGRVIDPDEQFPEVIDENGFPVVSDDENKIKEFIKNAISIDNFVETFNDNSHETLLMLLALQDNKHPLKKGGVGIAYRTDALIMHCKMEFSAEENVVFDAILGTISSYPSQKTYKIMPSNFIDFSKYKVENTLYDVFRKGTSKLKERHLVFEDLGSDGEDDIVVPWFDILRYHKKDKNNGAAYIEFKPSDFFKDLALCSGLVHGAFGSLEVTTQLQGKYTIALYWFLENMKNYREYPKATPGVFQMSIEELKHQFSMPTAYQKNDIERRALKPAYDSINSINECDFTFEYEAIKANGKYVGFTFRIQNKNYIDVKSREIDEIEAIDENPKFDQVESLLKMSALSFDKNEISKICSCMERNNKDLMSLMSLLPVFKSRLENTTLEPIEDKIAYMCSLIQNDDNVSKDVKKNNTNRFNNFDQRDYDMTMLEKKLLNSK